MWECRLGFTLRCLLQNTAGPSLLSLCSNHSCSTPLDSFQQQCSRMAVAAFVPALGKHLSDWISLPCLLCLRLSVACWIKVCPPSFAKQWWDAVKHNVCGHWLLWRFSAPVIKVSALTLRKQLQSIKPHISAYCHLAYSHMYLLIQTTRLCFFSEEKKHQPLFVSLFLTPLRTHASCIGCVVSPVQDSCTGFSIPEISPMPGYTPQLAPMHTHTSEAISHPLWTTPPSQTHTHVPMSSLLLFHRLRPVAPELTLLFTLPPYIPPRRLPSPVLQFSVTTAVCQLSACPSLVGDEAETQRVYREDRLASLPLPAVTPTSDFHLSGGLFAPSCSTTGSLSQHVRK